MSKSSDELVDVLDDSGNVVGVVTRREMRLRRLPHRCVYVLVFDSLGQLFIHHRTATKDLYPSQWDVCVGGVLATGESFDEAARREAGEELGVELDPQPLFPFRYSDGVTIAHAMVYRAIHDGPFNLQPEEIVRGEFVALNEVGDRVKRDPFCPDGLQVWAEYQRRL